MPLRPLLLLLCGALAGCGALGNPVTAPERAELRAAEQRWADRGAVEYMFEARVSCFCPPELNVWSRLRVVGDSVVERVALDPEPWGPSTMPLHYFPTVQRFFDVVRQARSGGSYLDDLQASYDPVLGYPRRIVQICKSNIADCGSTWEARNLVVIR